MATKIWAELGDWHAGIHLLVMHGEVDGVGRLIEKPDTLHDVRFAEGESVSEKLGALGYRVLPETQLDTPYGKAWDVEVL